MDGEVDLSGNWEAFWQAVTRSAGSGFTTAAAWLGMLVIIGALVVFFWRRTRGRSEEGTSGWVIWAVVFGSILAAPGFLMPAILTLIDVVANTGIGLWQASQGQAG
ncbi:hypothetical protein [Microlunatus speluncae]|uniref:hypothetical protein n=1 Tax=Microlunatus speluncae TaxID=2594267 RepID=UPI0012664189|nr:hypothetical protein [Microlunatus speluncae]